MSRALRHSEVIKGMDGARPIWPRRAGKSKKYAGSNVSIVGVDLAKDAIYAKPKLQAVGAGLLASTDQL